MANDIRSVIDSVWENGPISIPTQPDKARIRQEFGGTLQSIIDDLASIISTGTHAGEPVVVMATSNISIANGLENGDTVDGRVLATGDRVLLNGQTNPAQNGVYSVVASGAASRSTDADQAAELRGLTVFVKYGTYAGQLYTCAITGDIVVGTTPLSFVQTGDIPSAALKQIQRKQDAPLAFTRKPIFDLSALLSADIAVYWPRNGTFRNAADGEVFGVALTADSKMTAHTKVVLAQTTALQVIYYDRTDAAIKVATSPTNVPFDNDRYFFLAAIYGAGGQGTGRAGVITAYDYQSTSEQNSAIAEISGAFQYDNILGTLRIGTVYGYTEDGTSWTLSPPTGQAYREITGLTGSPISQVWLDVQDVLLNGATSSTAIHVTNGFASTPTITRRGEGRIILLGVSFGRNFTPADGIRVAKLVANEFDYGKDDNDRAPYFRYGDAVAVDLVEAASLGLGFTRGYQAAGGLVYYGGDFRKPAKSGVIYLRFLLEANTAGAFGEPRAYLRYRNSDGSEAVTSRTLADGDLTLVKEHSTKVREYEGFVSIVNGNEYLGCFAGSHNGAASAVRVFGLQYCYVAENNPIISRADYPRAPLAFDALIPPELLFVTGRNRYPLFVNQLTRCEADDRARAIASPTDTDTNGAYGTVSVAKEVIGGMLMPEGSGQRIALWDAKGRPTDHFERDVGYVAKTLVTGTKVGLFIGDSFFDTRGLGFNAVRRLQNMGFTITTAGSRDMISNYDTGTLSGEGRAGREMGDYTYAVTANMAPVTNWASYLALSNAGKAAYNPFIIAGSGPLSRNGYVVSLSNYKTQMSISNIDFVAIHLAVNDESNTGLTVAQRG